MFYHFLPQDFLGQDFNLDIIQIFMFWTYVVCEKSRK